MSQTARILTPTAPSTPPRGLTEIEWNRRILVVDDEKEIANAYVDLLSPQKKDNVTPIKRSSRSSAPAAPESSPSAENYELTVCHSAAEALIKAKQAYEAGKPYAMGFFDVKLGEGMDGIELVKEIHKIDPNIYAVFVTAYQDRNVNTINQFLGTTMADKWDYLNKPFSEGEILQKARNCVSLWNLKKEKEFRDQQFAEMYKRLHEGERLNSVAVVARGVAHEFGNIMMQIIGQAELYRDGSAEEMKKAMDGILRASDVAANILERFKNLGQPSQQNVRKETILATEPLENALQLMEHQLKMTKTKVCRIKNDKIEIYGCNSSLIQVYVNLIINAIHAMGTGGQIDLSVSGSDKWVEIIVRDYGPGIPKDIIGKIMEPFFTTKGSKGTGLGLAICREIVEVEHGGSLKVQNNPHKGAEFVIRIPVNGSGEEGTP